MESKAFFFFVAHICLRKKSDEHDGCTWGRHDGHRWHWQLSCFRDWEAAMRSEPVSVSRARPEWKERATRGCFRVNVGVDPVAFGQWILSIRSLNIVGDIMFLTKIFQPGITVAFHVNPQDPPSINLGLLGCKLSLGWLSGAQLSLCFFVDMWIGLE